MRLSIEPYKCTARSDIPKTLHSKCFTGTHVRRAFTMDLTKFIACSLHNEYSNNSKARRRLSRSDTAPVRQGEELNLESLATYLRAHLPSLATLPAATV